MTPTFLVGQVGYDSNVFYTQDHRTGDFVADGGPAVEVVLPMGSSFEIGGVGGVNFQYFAETESQRRTTWRTEAFARYESPRTGFDLGASRVERFRRPDFEVSDRIPELTRQATVTLRRALGRNEVRAGFEARRLKIDAGAEYRGADLARNLNRTTYRGIAGLRLALTSKTSFVIEGDHQADRFLVASSRDLDSNRLYGGFQIESATRLSGRAVAGGRRLQPLETGAAQWFPYVAIGLRYRLGPKTAVRLAVDRDQEFSAFEASEGTQTSRRLTSELALGRQLWGPVDIRLFGGYRQFETDGAIEIEQDDGTRRTDVRSDDEWFGGANLGFRFRSWFRVGFEARYSERNSNFDDLGVEGLLLGVTITATPGDLIDLVAND